MYILQHRKASFLAPQYINTCEFLQKYWFCFEADFRKLINFQYTFLKRKKPIKQFFSIGFHDGEANQRFRRREPRVRAIQQGSQSFSPFRKCAFNGLIFSYIAGSIADLLDKLADWSIYYPRYQQISNERNSTNGKSAHGRLADYRFIRLMISGLFKASLGSLLTFGVYYKNQII